MNPSLEDFMEFMKLEVEQARKTEKKIREIPPFYPQKKIRYQRSIEFNIVRENSGQNQGFKQTYVTANKHSSKVEDLSLLKPTVIKSMMVGKINYGRYLICRVIEEPYLVTAVSLLIEDENGDIEDFSIYSYANENNYKELLPKGTIIFIKEPFLKLAKDGMGRMIRVDSLSDILIDDFKFSGKFRNELIQLQRNKNADEFKKNGNDFYSKKKYELALRCYKLALNFNPNKPFLLYLNCSAANLELKLFSQAYSEAKKAVDLIMTEKTDDVAKLLEKARFRIAKAAYGMRQWKNAIENAQECLKLNPNNQESLELLQLAKTRGKEQLTGEYDFSKLYEKFLSDKKYDLDVADYQHKDLLIQENSLKGKHIIAKADIPKGTIIVVSKAFSFGTYDETKVPVISMNLITNLTDPPSCYESQTILFKNIHGNPLLAKEVYSLYSGKSFDRNEIIPDHIVDVSRLECIYSMNAFSGEDFFSMINPNKKENASKTSWLWIYPSLFNHSCIANTSRNFIGDIMILSSCRAIKKDEEITTNYIACVTSFEDRKKYLSKYEFDCCCELCEIDRNDTKRKEREKLLAKFKSPNPETINVLTEKKILDFIKSVEKTYEKRQKYRFGLLKPLALLQNYLIMNMRFEEYAKSHIETYEIVKDILPDMACLTALKTYQGYKFALNSKESDKWLEITKENDVFKNFKLISERFRDFF